MKCYDCLMIEGGKNPYCQTYIEGRKEGLIKPGEPCYWAKVVQSDLEKLAAGNPNLTFPQLKEVERRENV